MKTIFKRLWDFGEPVVASIIGEVVMTINGSLLLNRSVCLTTHVNILDCHSLGTTGLETFEDSSAG